MKHNLWKRQHDEQEQPLSLRMPTSEWLTLGGRVREDTYKTTTRPTRATKAQQV
jgi:hypothetical protein